MPQAPFTSTDPCICVQLKLLFPGPMSFHAALFYVYSCMALCVALVLTSWPRGLSHSLSLSCSHSHAVQFLIDTPCTWVQAPITLTAPPDLARRPLKHSRSHALAWLASAVPVPVGPSGVPGLAVPVPMGSLRGPWLAPAVPVPVGPSGVPGLAVPVPMGSLRGPWPRLCRCQWGPKGSRLCQCTWALDLYECRLSLWCSPWRCVPSLGAPALQCCAHGCKPPTHPRVTLSPMRRPGRTAVCSSPMLPANASQKRAASTLARMR
jgi:hypothetical protein